VAVKLPLSARIHSRCLEVSINYVCPVNSHLVNDITLFLDDINCVELWLSCGAGMLQVECRKREVVDTQRGTKSGTSYRLRCATRERI